MPFKVRTKKYVWNDLHRELIVTTTMADEECGDQTEDVGRVAGWIASFDKLLADPLGVQCLLVRGRDSACW